MLLLHWGSYCWVHNLWVLIIYLFFLPLMLPSVLARLAADSAVRVFPGVWKLLFLRLPSWDRAPSLPLLSLFFFVFYIFSYLLLTTMVCFSGYLMSSAGIQKVFCGIYSVFKYVLLMNLWGRKWSPHPIPPPS